MLTALKFSVTLRDRVVAWFFIRLLPYSFRNFVGLTKECGSHEKSKTIPLKFIY